MDKAKKIKLLGFIGCVLIMVSLFFTVIKLEIGTTGVTGGVKLINEDDGKGALVLSALTLLMIFAEDISPELMSGLKNAKLTLIATVVEFLILLNVIANAFEFYGNNALKHFGLGFYMMWVGVTIMFIYPVAHKKVLG